MVAGGYIELNIANPKEDRAMNKTETQKEPQKFDADLSPSAEVNKKAARTRGWTWSEKRGHYIDSDGCLMADRYGQPL